jgi:hypothetical protein
MEPTAIIVAALAQGAASAARPGSSLPAVQDGYRALKTLVERKCPGVNLALLEAEPTSKARQAVVAEDLQKLAGQDGELLQGAQALLLLLQRHDPAAGRAVGARLEQVEAKSLELSSISAQGESGATGVEVSRANIAGDIRISNVQASTAGAPAPRAGTAENNTAQKSTILFLAANPLDSVQLRLDAEVRAIDESLQKALLRDRFDLKQHWALRVADLQGLLLRHRPAIVHFSGHGDPTGAIALENESGATQPVAADALGQVFALLKGCVQCVVLNACFSAEQAQAIAEHVPCVVGMAAEFSDRAAVVFASAFYQALGFGEDVRTAFALGQAQLVLEGLGEQSTPALIAPNSDPARLFLAGDGKAHPKV